MFCSCPVTRERTQTTTAETRFQASRRQLTNLCQSGGTPQGFDCLTRYLLGSRYPREGGALRVDAPRVRKCFSALAAQVGNHPDRGQLDYHALGVGRCVFTLRRARVAALAEAAAKQTTTGTGSSGGGPGKGTVKDGHAPGGTVAPQAISQGATAIPAVVASAGTMAMGAQTPTPLRAAQPEAAAGAAGPGGASDATPSGAAVTVTAPVKAVGVVGAADASVGASPGGNPSSESLAVATAPAPSPLPTPAASRTSGDTLAANAPSPSGLSGSQNGVNNVSPGNGVATAAPVQQAVGVVIGVGGAVAGGSGARTANKNGKVLTPVLPGFGGAEAVVGNVTASRN